MSTSKSSVDRGSGDIGQYLTFMLGQETFAIGILAIKEIIEYGEVTAVPMMPPSVRGVLNLRGAVVPVVDLGVCFGRPLAAVGRRTCIVVVEVKAGAEERRLGLVVDAVQAVLDIGAQDVEPPPAFGAGIRTSFIAGMARRESGFVVIIDVAQVVVQLGVIAALEAAA